ncbi:MAG: hypothetical protein EOP10_03765 [Proteobacteria bacterium]|nr:MAG: hypothetical protein EOP10_03765 [Pseudomonadota bacterium]
MSHFASLVEHLSEKGVSSAVARKRLAEEMIPEMQKALDELRRKTGVFAFRIHMNEFEEGEEFECDFQVKWALSEDWRSFDGNLPPKFENYREDIYEITDAMDTLAPMIQQKIKLSSEPKING